MSTSGSFTPPAAPECAYAPRMTRAAALALRAAGGLLENCVVVITDGPTIGTAGNTSPTEIQLNPTGPSELGTAARVHTTFDNTAWAGLYDIDLGTAGSITELTDSWGNKAKDVDADSSTVHTQWPWHKGSATFRDNYAEDSTFAGLDAITVPFTDNTFRLTVATFGAITGGSGFLRNKADNLTLTVMRPTATLAHNQWEACTVTDLATTGTLTASNNDMNTGLLQVDAATTVNVTYSGNVVRNSHRTDVTGKTAGTCTITNNQLSGNAAPQAILASNTGNFTVSRNTLNTTRIAADAAGLINVIDSSLTTSTLVNSGGGGITVQQGCNVVASTLNNDAGSLKAISLTDVDARGVGLRNQNGPNTAAISIGASRIRSRPAAGDSILSVGDSGVSITGSDVNFPSQWLIDGVAGATVTVIDATIDRLTITRSNVAGRFDMVGGYATATIADHQGSGQMNMTASWSKNATLRLATGSSGNLSIQGGTIENGTMVVNSVRSLSMGVGSYVGGLATVTESGTTATTIASIGDRIDQSRVEGGASVTFSTTTGANTNQLSRSTVRGSSVGGEGVVTVTGTTDGAVIDNCQILGGIVTINNADAGLSGQSAFTDNHIGGGSTVTYTGGDATAKQIRNNRVEGLSTVTLTGLTGSAGAGLADVFGMSVRGQSTLSVTGARVPGQPIRDCTVEQGSTLNIPASGCTQRCRVAGGATLNTGAFVHFDTEMSLAATKTLTAANVNRLANKAFDDTL